MKIFRFPVLLILIMFTSCTSTYKEQLKKELKNNSLIVLNDTYVLFDPGRFIEEIDENSILGVETVSVDSIKYDSKYKSVVMLAVDTLAQEIINRSIWIEYRFIRNVNPRNNPLYMMDGMPMHDYQAVFQYLTNRVITKLNPIPANQAVAIWGKREGGNGAIQIWTEKVDGVTIIPVIIK